MRNVMGAEREGTIQFSQHTLRIKHGTKYERGVAGLDPTTRGRSPVLLEVQFRSRTLLKAEIQSEIVPGYLHYHVFCTV